MFIALTTHNFLFTSASPYDCQFEIVPRRPGALALGVRPEPQLGVGGVHGEARARDLREEWKRKKSTSVINSLPKRAKLERNP